MLNVLEACRELFALPGGGEMLPVAGVPGSQLACTEALGRATFQLPLKAFFGRSSCFKSLHISLTVCRGLTMVMTHLLCKTLCQAKRLRPKEGRWGQSLLVEVAGPGLAFQTHALDLTVCLFWNAGRGWLLGLCLEGASRWHLLLISLSHVSPHPLHTYLLTGVPS